MTYDRPANVLDDPGEKKNKRRKDGSMDIILEEFHLEQPVGFPDFLPENINKDKDRYPQPAQKNPESRTFFYISWRRRDFFRRRLRYRSRAFLLWRKLLMPAEDRQAGTYFEQA
jgi:hypothetical protein